MPPSLPRPTLPHPALLPAPAQRSLATPVHRRSAAPLQSAHQPACSPAQPRHHDVQQHHVRRAAVGQAVLQHTQPQGLVGCGTKSAVSHQCLQGGLAS